MTLLGLFLTAAVSSSALTLATPQPIDLFPRAAPAASVVNQTTCDGKTFTYQQLAGYGFVASDARDKFGDTLGGYGSAIALDRQTWKKTGEGTYTGLLYAIPDRGWYVARRQLYLISRL